MVCDEIRTQTDRIKNAPVVVHSSAAPDPPS